MKSWTLTLLIALGSVFVIVPVIFYILAVFGKTSSSKSQVSKQSEDKNSQTENFSPFDNTNGIDLSQLGHDKTVSKRIVADMRWSESEKLELIDLARKSYPDKKLFEDQKNVEIMFFAPYWVAKENAYLAVMRLYTAGKLSVMYAAFYNSEWKKIQDPRKFGNLTLPSIVPITIFWGQTLPLGPEDPRIFEGPDAGLYVVFNMMVSGGVRRMHVYDFTRGTSTELKISLNKKGSLDQMSTPPFYVENGLDLGGSRFEIKKSSTTIPRIQKNWAPFTLNGYTYFLYNQSGPCLFNCNLVTGECLNMSESLDGFNKISSMRGGTSFLPVPKHLYPGVSNIKKEDKKEQTFNSKITGHSDTQNLDDSIIKSKFNSNIAGYEGDEYFFSFTFYHDPNWHTYRPSLQVIHVPEGDAEQTRSIYFSDSIGLEHMMFENQLQNNQKTNSILDLRIIIAVSIARFEYDPVSGLDSLLLAVNLQDTSSPIIEINGLGKILNQIISLHRKDNLRFAKTSSKSTDPLDNIINMYSSDLTKLFYIR